MKYVIYEAHGLVHPVLFGNHTTHKEAIIPNGTPVSAGFVKFDTFGWPHVYGDSESLKLGKRGELDEDIIRRSMDNDTPTYLFMTEFNQPEDLDDVDPHHLVHQHLTPSTPSKRNEKEKEI